MGQPQIDYFSTMRVQVATANHRLIYVSMMMCMNVYICICRLSCIGLYYVVLYEHRVVFETNFCIAQLLLYGCCRIFIIFVHFCPIVRCRPTTAHLVVWISVFFFGFRRCKIPAWTDLFVELCELMYEIINLKSPGINLI